MIKDKKFKILKHWWLSGGVSYNSYVTAYVNRIIALGYTMPSASRLAALNTLTTSLVSVLPKCDIFYMYALNNILLSNAASLNLVNPSLYQSTYVNSPTYGIRGIMPDGSTSYVDTNFNPATNGVNYTLNSASRGFYLETVPTIGTRLEGTLTSINRNNTQYDPASTTAVRINSSNSLSAAVDPSGIGYKSINRVDSTNVSFYNGTTKSDRTQTSVVVISENQVIGATGGVFSNGEFGFYFMGASLSQAEHALIRSSYLTYKTAIGL